MFKRLLIANRGEIALRVARACRELDIDPVMVYSEADRDALHVQLAARAYCIGPAPAQQSYLNGDAILTVAKAAGCDAIHPGYGFLSENAAFAQECVDEGFAYVGPAAHVIEAMGNKAAAREMMKRAGVPVVPGSDGSVANACEGARIAKEIGYPVLIKAAAGGGGRGMRRVYDPDRFEELFEEARAESRACFNDDEMYLEKLIVNPHHIEFQILADSQGTIVHLGDRDCSIQRRGQKMIEETPSHVLSDELRERMGAAAVAAARAAGYQNAGTVEFVLDHTGEFYFIEMNTRVQVEHPVSELISGVDIVCEQIRIAAGERLRYRQRDIVLRGHAIECRINAEDPFTFVPCPGRITAWHLPGGPGIRIDSHVFAGYTVPPYYDSMIGKLIAYGDTREQAIARMRIALSEFACEGIKTNVKLHRLLLSDERFARGGTSIHYLEEKLRKRAASGVAEP